MKLTFPRILIAALFGAAACLALRQLDNTIVARGGTRALEPMHYGVVSLIVALAVVALLSRRARPRA